MEEQQDVVDSLMRPERLANVIGQSPTYIRNEIASLVEGEEQIPGSFGDLIKRSLEMTIAHEEYKGSNVVSIFWKIAS